MNYYNDNTLEEKLITLYDVYNMNTHEFKSNEYTNEIRNNISNFIFMEAIRLTNKNYALRLNWEYSKDYTSYNNYIAYDSITGNIISSSNIVSVYTIDPTIIRSDDNLQYKNTSMFANCTELLSIVFGNINFNNTCVYYIDITNIAGRDVFNSLYQEYLKYRKLISIINEDNIFKDSYNNNIILEDNERISNNKNEKVIDIYLIRYIINDNNNDIKEINIPVEEGIDLINIPNMDIIKDIIISYSNYNKDTNVDIISISKLDDNLIGISVDE